MTFQEVLAWTGLVVFVVCVAALVITLALVRRRILGLGDPWGRYRR